MSQLLDLGQGTWPALCAVACGLGARHALDADHISVIDGIARRNLTRRLATARSGGVLFSLGHCFVVAFVASAAVILAAEWHTPLWLETTGALVTVAVLLVLAALNLHVAWRSPPDRVVVPVGWKTRLLRDRAGDHPLMIVGVGALFAMSLDTISQAGAIGLAARAFGGEGTALAAAGWFGLGMTAVGGANGLWIVGLLRSPGARTGSRLMTGAIGLVNLVIGLLALAGIFAPAVVRWREQSGMVVTGTVIATFCLTFLAALWIHKSRGDGIGNAAAPLGRAG